MTCWRMFVANGVQHLLFIFYLKKRCEGQKAPHNLNPLDDAFSLDVYRRLSEGFDVTLMPQRREISKSLYNFRSIHPLFVALSCFISHKSHVLSFLIPNQHLSHIEKACSNGTQAETTAPNIMAASTVASSPSSGSY